MSDITLAGLRADNPMAFLAALGALSLASDGSDGPVALSWERGPDGSWRPVLHGLHLDTPENVIKMIVAAHRRRDLDQELGVEDKNLMRVSRDDLRRLLEQRLTESKDSKDSRAAWMLAACLCELPERTLQNPKGIAVSYTPFRVVPRKGNTVFLKAALSECEAGVDHLHTCLFEPWQYHRKTQSLRWDPGAAVQMRALMAQAPTHLGPSGVPGAVLLAIRGLAYCPLVTSHAGRNGQAAPPGMPQRKGFIWPIWSEPLGERAARMMLSIPWLQALFEARDEESRATGAKFDRQMEHKAKNKLAHAHNQLRAHGVFVCYAAPRVHRGDDDEALGWGEPIII